MSLALTKQVCTFSLSQTKRRQQDSEMLADEVPTGTGRTARAEHPPSSGERQRSIKIDCAYCALRLLGSCASSTEPSTEYRISTVPIAARVRAITPLTQLLPRHRSTSTCASVKYSGVLSCSAQQHRDSRLESDYLACVNINCVNIYRRLCIYSAIFAFCCSGGVNGIFVECVRSEVYSECALLRVIDWL